MPLTAGTRIGAYEILRMVGAGGMGEVYLARDTRLNRDVAIKILPAAPRQEGDPLARFRREARVLASLNQPNIAAVYGFEESDGLRAMVMEFVQGRTLTDIVGIHEPSGTPALTLAETLDIARQVLYQRLVQKTPQPSVMAVALTLSPELKAGRPRELFKADIFDGLHTKDVMPDGSKFLVVQKSRETPPPARLTVVTDWSGRK